MSPRKSLRVPKRFKDVTATKSGTTVAIAGPPYSRAEQAIIAVVAKNKGRPLTREEANLVLAQAKAIHGDDLTG
jgi:hypothetical protein